MSPKEIFILEDDRAVREMLCIVLTKAGYEPICFADGTALLISARQRYCTCVLLDVVLPGRSGLEILHELQKARYPSPILMISGHASIQIAVQAGRMGAIDFIEKPFKGRDLIERIEDATRSQTSVREEQQGYVGTVSAFPGMKPFTGREQQVVDQLLLGKSTKDIALLLKLSSRTIDIHRSSILHKAKVKTTSQLVASRIRAPNPY
jgi:FixJ family two-component response regulator